MKMKHCDIFILPSWDEAFGVVYLEAMAVSYTHLRAHETVLDLVCRLLLEKKNNKRKYKSEINSHVLSFALLVMYIYSSLTETTSEVR